MIKFYKTLKDYAKEHNICRQTASTLFKAGKINLIKVPKWAKYIWITIK